MFSILPILPPKEFLRGKRSTLIPGNNVLWLVFDSTDQGLEQFYQFTDFMKRAWNIADSCFINIQTALSEAVMNAVDHGNKREKEKSVYINACRYERYFTFLVEDEGEGFDYNQVENPTRKENRLKEGGRGIFIMNLLAEDVDFEKDGRMVKLLFANR